MTEISPEHQAHIAELHAKIDELNKLLDLRTASSTPDHHIRRVAYNYGESHNMCTVLNDALADLGVAPIKREHDVTIEVTLRADFLTPANNSEHAFSIAEEAFRDSVADMIDDFTSIRVIRCSNYLTTANDWVDPSSE